MSIGTTDIEEVLPGRCIKHQRRDISGHALLGSYSTAKGPTPVEMLPQFPVKSKASLSTGTARQIVGQVSKIALTN